MVFSSSSWHPYRYSPVDIGDRKWKRDERHVNRLAHINEQRFRLSHLVLVMFCNSRLRRVDVFRWKKKVICPFVLTHKKWWNKDQNNNKKLLFMFNFTFRFKHDCLLYYKKNSIFYPGKRIFLKRAHPDGFHVFFFDGFWTAEKFLFHPFKNIPNRFGCWNNIEWGWACSSLFKIANPQPGPREFPFNVSSFLQKKNKKYKERERIE